MKSRSVKLRSQALKFWVLGIAVVLVAGVWVIGAVRSDWACGARSVIGCQVKDDEPDNNTSGFKDGQRVSVAGKFVCLPHKDTSGPQTMECAYGLRADDGTYYALRDTTADYSLISKVSMDVPVIVSGTYKKEATTIYQSQGQIFIDAVDKATGHNE